jgi:uncharacterized protein (DUF1697 family)
MKTVVCLLRAVNVGGHAVIKMAELKALYESLKFHDVQTYVQSGNIVFRSESSDLDAVATKIRAAIEKRFHVTPGVMLRTVDDLKRIVKRNPFAKRSGIEPAKLHVCFLQSALSRAAISDLGKLTFNPEELVPSERELFIYFPNGAGNSKLPWRAVDRICGAPGTSRNWNTVNKLLQMAEQLEAQK